MSQENMRRRESLQEKIIEERFYFARNSYDTGSSEVQSNIYRTLNFNPKHIKSYGI